MGPGMNFEDDSVQEELPNITKTQNKLEYRNQHVIDNMGAAYQRMIDNIQREASEIDPKLMFLKLKKGFIELYGQVNGLATAYDSSVETLEHIRVRFNENNCELKKQKYSVEQFFNKPWYKRLYFLLFGKLK